MPLYVQEPPVFTILENQQPFVSFGSIQTEDFDIPPNNEVFFFIIGKFGKVKDIVTYASSK